MYVCIHVVGYTYVHLTSLCQPIVYIHNNYIRLVQEEERARIGRYIRTYVSQMFFGCWPNNTILHVLASLTANAVVTTACMTAFYS